MQWRLFPINMKESRHLVNHIELGRIEKWIFRWCKIKRKIHKSFRIFSFWSQIINKRESINYRLIQIEKSCFYRYKRKTDFNIQLILSNIFMWILCHYDVIDSVVQGKLVCFFYRRSFISSGTKEIFEKPLKQKKWTSILL